MAPGPPARQSVRASMDFSGPLNALSVSPSKRLIAVGGRDGARAPRASPLRALVGLNLIDVVTLWQCSRSWRWTRRGSRRSATCACLASPA